MLSLLGPAEVSAHSVTWLGALLEVSSKGAITLVAAAALALALRRASAASRHLVWNWALICVLALPVLSFVLPSWRVAMLPQILSGARTEQAVNSSDPAPVSIGHEAQQSQSQESASLSVDIDSVLSKKFQLSSPSAVEAEQVAPLSDGAFHTPSRAGLHWSVWILIIWLAGMFVVYLRLLIGIISVWRMARRATEISDSEWASQARSLASRLRIGRPVRLLKSDRVSTPLTWGCLKSEVLLPSDAARWSADRRQVVLLHELAHVRRRDWLTQTIAQIVCALYWFNPLVWVAARRLRAESERACDDHVLGIGTRPSDYAGHLLDIARSLSAAERSSPAAATMARRSQLEGRLLAILNPALSRRGLSRLVSFLVGTALACVVLPLAAVRPLAQDDAIERAEAEALTDGSAMFATAAAPAFKSAPEVAKTSSRVPEKVEGTQQEATESIQMPEENQQASEQVTEPRVQKDRAVVQGLVDALKDEDPQVRRQAAFALSKTDDARAAEALIASLNDSDWQVRAQAVWALGLRPGQIPVERLIVALKDSVSQVRSQAAWSLGLKGDGSAVEALIEALKDEDAQVRSQAAWALGLKGDSRAVEPLIQALRDENRQVRSQAAWALGLKGDSRAVEPLLAALRDADRNVRAQSAWALGLKGDRRALRPLNDARKDEDGHVRKQASWALGMILMKLGDADDIDLDLNISPVVRSDIKVNPRSRENPKPRVKPETNEASTKPLD